MSFSSFNCLLLGAGAKPFDPFRVFSDWRASFFGRALGWGRQKRGGPAHKLPVLSRIRQPLPQMTVTTADSEELSESNWRENTLLPKQRSVKEALFPPMSFFFNSTIIGFRVKNLKVWDKNKAISVRYHCLSKAPVMGKNTADKQRAGVNPQQSG